MKLLFLSVLTFVLISTSALSLQRINNKYLNSERNSVVVQIRTNNYTTETFAKLPTLSSSSTFPVLSAQAVVATDLDSGVALYEKEPDKPLLPASTTKIVTALVAMDYYSPNEVLRVGNIKSEGQRMRLVVGEEITVDSLLRGLLIASANDAAEVLAQNYPGGKEMFISVMNEKASELNLDNTNFANPSGLDAVGHVSTARDLIRVSAHAMENPYFSEIVGTEKTLVESVDERFAHKLVNINELLGKIDGVLGVKTGWTEEARENLITYVERGGHRVMIAVLGSQDRFGETEELIEWIFDNYEWQDVNYP